MLSFPLLFRALELIELALLAQLLLDAFCRQLQVVSDALRIHQITDRQHFRKSVALANGIKDAHFVSRYSISGLVCPLSRVLIGRNVRGPSVWQPHRFHRGLGTSTRPNTVLT